MCPYTHAHPQSLKGRIGSISFDKMRERYLIKFGNYCLYLEDS